MVAAAPAPIPARLLALPELCTAHIAAHLRLEDLLRLTEASPAAARIYGDCILSARIRRPQALAGGGHAPAAEDLPSVLGRLRHLETVKIDLPADVAARALQMHLPGGAGLRIRHLRIRRQNDDLQDFAAYVQPPIAVADLITGGQLPALERLIVKHRMEQESAYGDGHLQTACSTFLSSLGHVDAPRHLTCLVLGNILIARQSAEVLARAIEARAARGCSPFAVLGVRGWPMYAGPDGMGPAERIYTRCLPSMRKREFEGVYEYACCAEDSDAQIDAAQEALARALWHIPAPNLEALKLEGLGGSELADLARALLHVSLPRLKLLELDGSFFQPGPLNDMQQALQHRLVGLRSLRLRGCDAINEAGQPLPGGLSTLVEAFEQGGGACLTEIMVGDDHAFDERLASAIEGGACPNLKIISSHYEMAMEALETRQQAAGQQEEQDDWGDEDSMDTSGGDEDEDEEGMVGYMSIMKMGCRERTNYGVKLHANGPGKAQGAKRSNDKVSAPCFECKWVVHG